MIKALRAWLVHIKRALVYDEYDDVRAFYQKFGWSMGNKPTPLHRARVIERTDFMQEELNEFKLGARNADLSAMADALVDLVYVAKGTALEMGLPWEELWQDVQRANMGKVPAATARMANDAIKPSGWAGPQTEDILIDHGAIL